jgi:hypothetical protein
MALVVDLLDDNSQHTAEDASSDCPDAGTLVNVDNEESAAKGDTNDDDNSAEESGGSASFFLMSYLARLSL